MLIRLIKRWQWQIRCRIRICRSLPRISRRISSLWIRSQQLLFIIIFECKWEILLTKMHNRRRKEPKKKAMRLTNLSKSLMVAFSASWSSRATSSSRTCWRSVQKTFALNKATCWFSQSPWIATSTKNPKRRKAVKNLLHQTRLNCFNASLEHVMERSTSMTLFWFPTQEYWVLTPISKCHITSREDQTSSDGLSPPENIRCKLKRNGHRPTAKPKWALIIMIL